MNIKGVYIKTYWPVRNKNNRMKVSCDGGNETKLDSKKSSKNHLILKPRQKKKKS